MERMFLLGKAVIGRLPEIAAAQWAEAVQMKERTQKQLAERLETIKSGNGKRMSQAEMESYNRLLRGIEDTIRTSNATIAVGIKIGKRSHEKRERRDA